MLENGQVVSRTTYADLYSVIGTTYGTGDGSTTFNVPNSTNRVQVGKGFDTNFDVLGETGGATTHNHSVPAHAHNLSGAGWARIAPDIAGNDWWGIDYVALGSSRTADKRTNATPGVYDTATSYARGAVLDGATDSGGAGTSGTSSSLQPYITINRAIKY